MDPSQAPILTRSLGERNQIVAEVCRLLEETYGRPRLGNPHDPVDDLVYIMLSNKTGPSVARKVFGALKGRFPRWDSLTRARANTLQSILKPAGLSTIKSEQIREAFRRIRRDMGTISLRTLRRYSEPDALAYLTSLPGVSEKVAKCVMMYTLGFEVLPVDVHVHRVARRLGWTTKGRADQCHEELEELVPPPLRYAFHVDCVAHGQRLCRPSNPLCGPCPIKQYCRYYAANR